jgi:hypothetical protein
MAQRRTTAPPTRVSSRSSRDGRSGLIAKEKTESNQHRGGPSLTIAFIEPPWCKPHGRCPRAEAAAVAADDVRKPSGELQLP